MGCNAGLSESMLACNSNFSCLHGRKGQDTRFQSAVRDVADRMTPFLPELNKTPAQSRSSEVSAWWQALEGLRVILSVRPQSLNAMVPKLMRPPLNSNNLRAVGALAEVSGTLWGSSDRIQGVGLSSEERGVWVVDGALCIQGGLKIWKPGLGLS